MSNSSRMLLFIAIQVMIILAMLGYIVATVTGHCTDPNLPNLMICS